MYPRSLRTDNNLKVVVLERVALREIFEALRGKIDLESISKILNDFSRDLFMYFKSCPI
jgi:uncharacterized protein (DUF2267 family)